MTADDKMCLVQHRDEKNALLISNSLKKGELCNDWAPILRSMNFIGEVSLQERNFEVGKFVSEKLSPGPKKCYLSLLKSFLASMCDLVSS